MLHILYTVENVELA